MTREDLEQMKKYYYEAYDFIYTLEKIGMSLAPYTYDNWLKKGEEDIQNDKRTYSVFCDYIQDIVFSDRETMAYGIAYERMMYEYRR